MLQIHNSLTGQKEVFQPIEPGKVRMYVCGITVYDYCHLGHARMLIAFDMVRRYLRSLGYEVNYVRNITDIDDKIITRARENNEPIDQLTARFIQAMNEDCAALAIETPDLEPRATQYVPAIVSMVQKLVKRGYAYVGYNNDVYYSVGKFADYGKLSGKRLSDLRAGARVEIAEAKQDPLDFVLWKAAKPGEPSWNSPWGPGRPGWHIECSAMATQILGPHFDIHGGGLDLKFPHHENEIAQSCAACEQKFVNVWMHNGFVRVDNEKMSKSLGNFFTVRDVLKRFHPEVVRYFMLASHYSGPINYSQENLEQAKAALTRLCLALRPYTDAPEVANSGILPRFRAAMDDDFNTPEAIAAIQGVAGELNTAHAAGKTDVARHLAGEMKELGRILGLLSDPEGVLTFVPTVAVIQPGSSKLKAETQAPTLAALKPADIEDLIRQRVAARARKDFKESDRIRDELAAKGILLEDGPKGTQWRMK
jgi:cysteinyl-tRNA synthetase